MVRVEYQCEDGTPFPVVFESEADAAVSWRRDLEHTPRPLTPLADALNRLGDGGARRAYDEVGMVRPNGFRAGPAANGFAYYCEEMVTGEEMARLFEAGSALVEQYGSAFGVWQDYCLPLVREDCAGLDAVTPDTPLATVADLGSHCLHVTMIPAFIGGHDVQQLTAVLTDTYGDAATLVANELTHGYENPTLLADRELWRLGQLVAASPSVAAALRSDEPAAAMVELRASGRDPEFFAALHAFLAEFGKRSEGWDIADPVWAEQGAGFWAQLRQMATPGVTDPAEALARASTRRAERVAEVEEALAGNPDALARFGRRVDRVKTYVAVREERAYWQLVACGAQRTAVLRRAAPLVERGLLDSPDDILFLLPAEIETPGAPDPRLRSLASDRRTAHARWSQRTPPTVIGKLGADAAPLVDDNAAQAGSPQNGVVRGVGASRGVVTATARVITDLADAGRLEPGDVLVCVMTSPPWTPLFGLASAVVADSGDIGSHVAIAAREYGIPCVLGTKSGTARIPDGSVVTVDGAAGVVQLTPSEAPSPS